MVHSENVLIFAVKKHDSHFAKLIRDVKQRQGKQTANCLLQSCEESKQQHASESHSQPCRNSSAREGCRDEERIDKNQGVQSEMRPDSNVSISEGLKTRQENRLEMKERESTSNSDSTFIRNAERKKPLDVSTGSETPPLEDMDNVSLSCLPSDGKYSSSDETDLSDCDVSIIAEITPEKTLPQTGASKSFTTKTKESHSEGIQKFLHDCRSEETTLSNTTVDLKYSGFVSIGTLESNDCEVHNVSSSLLKDDEDTCCRVVAKADGDAVSEQLDRAHSAKSPSSVTPTKLALLKSVASQPSLNFAIKTTDSHRDSIELATVSKVEDSTTLPSFFGTAEDTFNMKENSRKASKLSRHPVGALCGQRKSLRIRTRPKYSEG